LQQLKFLGGGGRANQSLLITSHHVPVVAALLLLEKAPLPPVLALRVRALVFADGAI